MLESILGFCFSIRIDIVQTSHPWTQVGIAAVIVICLYSLATPQPHRLTILLQLCNQLVTLLHHIIILLVLVVWSVGLNNTLSGDTVDCARDPLSRNKLGQITVQN